MILKCEQDITLADLPKIEDPFFAVCYLQSNFSAYNGAQLIGGIQYVFSKEYPYTRFEWDRYTLSLLRESLENGSIFLVHDGNEKPFNPVVKWKEDSTLKKKGQWVLTGPFHVPVEFFLKWIIHRVMNPIPGPGEGGPLLKMSTVESSKVPSRLGVVGQALAAMNTPVRSKPSQPKPSLESKEARLNKNADIHPKCTEYGHPVNAVTGAVVETVTDFVLPGRIPLVWERHYCSQTPEASVLGPGWQCPADARITVDEDGAVIFHNGTKTARVFPHLPDKKAVTDPKKDYYLYQTDYSYRITGKNNITYHFPKYRD